MAKTEEDWFLRGGERPKASEPDGPVRGNPHDTDPCNLNYEVDGDDFGDIRTALFAAGGCYEAASPGGFGPLWGPW